MSDYTKKYQKYKLKYNDLKKKQKLLKGGSGYRFKSKFGSDGNGDGQFRYPEGIAGLTNGDIAICDRNSHRVQIFDSNGIFKSKFGSDGNGDGQFRYPSGITVLANGDIAICDKNNHRVQIFDSNGIFKSKFGSEGTSDGQFRYPSGITVLANEDIVVSDAITNRVQIFDSNGIFKSKFGSQGNGDGQFNSLEGIGVLANGDIVVSDAITNRVQIFESNEDVSGNLDVSGNHDFQTPERNFQTPERNTRQRIPSMFPNIDVSGNLLSQFDNAEDDLDNIDDIDEITPINIQDVLRNINYRPYTSQSSIDIKYLEIGTKKIFDFDENKEFIDSTNPTNPVKVHVKHHNLFETLYKHKIHY